MISDRDPADDFSSRTDIDVITDVRRARKVGSALDAQSNTLADNAVITNYRGTMYNDGAEMLNAQASTDLGAFRQHYPRGNLNEFPRNAIEYEPNLSKNWNSASQPPMRNPVDHKRPETLGQHALLLRTAILKNFCEHGAPMPSIYAINNFHLTNAFSSKMIDIAPSAISTNSLLTKSC